MPSVAARRICLVRTSALGDVVHTLALVNGLRHGYPDAHLTWILHPLGYDAVREQPNVDRFLVFPRRGLAGWRSLARALRRERFDLCLVPQVSFKSSLVAALVRADVKLGFDWARSRELHVLFTNRRLAARPPGHVQDAYLEFLDALGITGYPPRWDIAFTEEELAWRDRFFAALGRPAAAFVVASSDRRKDWSVEGYARVMERVEDELGLAPLVVGGPSRREHEAAAEIVRQCQARVAVALERPVRRTLLQLSGAAVVVSPDTGPLHAAVALGVPTVGLYGFTDPRRCGPYRAFGDLLVDRYTDPGREDAPVTRRTKAGRMARITPDEVFAKIALARGRYAGRAVGRRTVAANAEAPMPVGGEER